MLTIRFESFVESDSAPRSVSVEGPSEKDLRWNPLEHKFRHVFESEFPVVLPMSDETTSFGIQGFQPQQSLQYQGLADPPSLMLRQNRNRPKSVPVPGAIRNRHGREGIMSYHTAIQFRDQRRFEGFGDA